MATIKIACPKCGQKVSGDESFSGAVVECPICSSKIKFPSGIENFTTAASQNLPNTPAGSPEASSHGDLPTPPESDAPVALPQDSPGIPLATENWEEGDAEIPSPLFGAISLVCGILGIVTCGLAAPLCAPLAIIFGHTALARGKHSPLQPPPGRNLAMIGLIIGYVSLLFAILLLAAAAIFRQPLAEYIQRSLH